MSPCLLHLGLLPPRSQLPSPGPREAARLGSDSDSDDGKRAAQRIYPSNPSAALKLHRDMASS